jgi:hypothetical protein
MGVAWLPVAHALRIEGLVRYPVLILVLAAACGDNAEAPDAAPPVDAPPRAQGSEATSDLVINEIAPRGAGPDWIELHNRGATPIDLCGVFLTDSVDRLDHLLPLGGVMPPAACSPRELAPGAYLVIDADDTPIAETGPIDPGHAPFALGIADEVHLVSITGTVIDGLLYLYPPGPEAPADVTLARVPDGSGAFWTRPPTPGAANPEAP